mmetsp:Transcript_28545/g.37042  ORF Transcript_28545/g.37042 Transcript_28545/m.37042 type:complete len:686 (+) Transcript_28545:104-2161(+)
MGNRVKGKVKKKSIKAKVTSSMGSKRRLSRMGKEMKKGMRGYSANYITRSQILKRLQITLKDFRRLCILKGIYPRDPKKQVKGKHQTYYHIKDVSHLAHEPLLAKFREFKAFMKKIRRSVGRGELSEVERKEKAKPSYTLHHLVKERYPRFTDALLDLDDALCMVTLFAYLPAEKRVRTERTDACQRLMREWQYFVAYSGSLTKTFVSIKGIYFQAEVMGQSITWVAPHQFTQHVPKEVDFRVMLTFLEFYEVFVKFVLFKLYSSLGLRYPPVFDSKLDEIGCNLRAIIAKPVESEAETTSLSADQVKEEKEVSSMETVKQQQQSAGRIDSLENKLKQIQAMEEKNEESEMGEKLTKPLEQAFHSAMDSEKEEQPEPTEEGGEDFEEESVEKQRKKLFKGLTFFLGREVPRGWIEFVILSFGGRVGWDGPGSPFDAKDASITHQIVDRGGKGHVYFNREYVQPQWIFDSANNLMLLPLARYAPGAELPPHLSPFVDNEAEGYTPAYATELESLKAAARGEVPTAVEEDEGEERDKKGEEGDEERFARELEQEAQGMSFSAATLGKEDQHEERHEEGNSDKENSSAAEDENGSDESSEEEEEESSELANQSVKPAKQSEEAEIHEMAQIMMSKKAKRLYGRMQHGLKKKKDAIEKLEAKRRKIDEEKATASPLNTAEKKKKKKKKG